VYDDECSLSVTPLRDMASCRAAD